MKFKFILENLEAIYKHCKHTNYLSHPSHKDTHTNVEKYSLSLLLLFFYHCILATYTMTISAQVKHLLITWIYTWTQYVIKEALQKKIENNNEKTIGDAKKIKRTVRTNFVLLYTNIFYTWMILWKKKTFQNVCITDLKPTEANYIRTGTICQKTNSIS